MTGYIGRNPAGVSTTTTTQQKTPVPVEESNAIIQAIIDTNLKGIRGQREGINTNLEKLTGLKEEAKLPKHQDLSAIMAMADIVGNTGGQYSKYYKLVKDDSLKKQISGLEELLAQQQKGLANSEIGLASLYLQPKVVEGSVTKVTPDKTTAPPKPISEKMSADLDNLRSLYFLVNKLDSALAKVPPVKKGLVGTVQTGLMHVKDIGDRGSDMKILSSALEDILNRFEAQKGVLSNQDIERSRKALEGLKAGSTQEQRSLAMKTLKMLSAGKYNAKLKQIGPESTWRGYKLIEGVPDYLDDTPSDGGENRKKSADEIRNKLGLT